MEQGLEDGGDSRPNTLLVYFKNVVQAFEARFKQLGGKIVDRGELRDRREQRAQAGGQPAERRRRPTSIVTLDRRSASCRRSSPASARSATTTPILNSWAGDGTYWLPKNPPISNYYSVTYASAFGDDPSKAVNALAKKVKAGTGGFVTGAGGDRRRRHRDQAGEGLHERRLALAAQMEKFKKVPTHLRARELLAAAPHGVRAPVPRDPHPEQQAEDRRHGDGEGRPEDLGDLAATRRSQTRAVARSSLRATAVSRSFEGVQALADVDARAPATRGRRPDRPERRGQVDARQRAERVRRPDVGHGRARRRGRDPLAARTAAAGQASRERSSTAARSGASPSARTSRSRRSARAPGRREARRRADELLDAARARPAGRRVRQPRSRTVTSGGSAWRARSRRSRATC